MRDRTEQELEIAIAADRLQLERSLDALMGRTTRSALSAQAAGLAARAGKPAASVVAGQVRKKPVAALLAGVGIAWLIAGPSLTRKMADNKNSSDESAALEARLKAMEAKITRTTSQEQEEDMTLVERQTERAKDKWSDLKSQTKVAKRRAYRRAAELRERIDEGTSDLSETARTRVRKARAAAIAAQAHAEAMIERLGHGARATAHENPLLVGAAAIAAGAAIGATLPNGKAGKRRYRTFGAYRDHLFDEAERVYREEARKQRQTRTAPKQATLKASSRNGQADHLGVEGSETTEHARPSRLS